MNTEKQNTKVGKLDTAFPFLGHVCSYAEKCTVSSTVELTQFYVNCSTTTQSCTATGSSWSSARNTDKARNKKPWV